VQTEYEFSVSLNTDERLDVDLIRETLFDVQEMLRDIERQVSSGKKAKAHWLWDQPDPRLTFAATVNGATAETLSRVVDAAAEGFERASEAGEQTAAVQWPAEFGIEARKRARRILERLERLESITIAATGRDPLVINRAFVGKSVVGRQSRRRIWSSVEGVMRMIAGGDKVIRAGIREHGSGAYVTVTLDAETWHERVRGWWDQRVVVDGRVAYAEDGRPLSIIEVTDIRPRLPGRPLKDFLGAAPGLAGHGSDDDVIAEMRGHG
jgi:hypothetical protein